VGDFRNVLPSVCTPCARSEVPALGRCSSPPGLALLSCSLRTLRLGDAFFFSRKPGYSAIPWDKNLHRPAWHAVFLTATFAHLVGPVYALASSPVGIIAGIGSNVVIYRHISENLEPVVSYGGFTVVLDVQTNSDGTKLLVGDLMRSVSLLKYDAEEQSLSLLARDFSPRWISACLLLSDDGEEVDTSAQCDRVVIADSSFNLALLNHQTNTHDEDIVRLANVGEMYSGSFINRFRVGSLSSLGGRDCVIWGAIDGSIGLIAPLTAEQHGLLRRLQVALSSVVGGVGGFDRKEFLAPNRTFRTGASDAGALIDGDLCEMLLELDQADQSQVLRSFDSHEAEEILTLVESLNRMK
jgi:hypothetical protein